MADIIRRFPLVGEYPETILARLVADLNAGIDPADPLYADMEPGSIWDDLNRAMVLELDRVYDRMHTDIPTASLPSTATGKWLDEWARIARTNRTDAAAATGTVRFAGPNGTDVPTGIQVSTEAPNADADPISFATTAGGTIEVHTDGTYVDLPVAAVDAGSQGNVAAAAVVLLQSTLPVDGVTVTNPAKITGGGDVETDEHLQARVVARLQGTNGAGNLDFYANVALEQPGIGFATVRPTDPIQLVVTDLNNDPLSPVAVAALQQLLDPSATPAQGAGLAPPGATVVVSTATFVNVEVDADVQTEPGYSLTGTGTTQALEDEITNAVRLYVESLPPGAAVILNRVLAAIISVEGVRDVAGVELNGDPEDLTIAAGAVPTLTSIALT